MPLLFTHCVCVAVCPSPCVRRRVPRTERPSLCVAHPTPFFLQVGQDFNQIYVGLRGYVLVECTALTTPTTDGEQSFYGSDDFSCTNTLYSFSDNLHDSWSGTCKPACSASIVTAFSGIYGCTIAMLGTLNRMRPASDAPQQKMMGSIFDTFGSFTLAVSLLGFEGGCYWQMGTTGESAAHA